MLGGIALTAATGNGTWAFSTDGSTYTAIGTVSPNSALLVPAGATLRYTPDGKNGETARITYRAWDATSGVSGAKVDTTASGGATAFSTATDTASLTVTSVNDAPVLTGASPSLGTTAPGAAKTIALSAFINGGTGTTTITDADTGAVVGGIALTATTGGGTWAYSTDGSTFTSVGTVSASSALLLPAGATLRYTPSASSSETARSRTAPGIRPLGRAAARSPRPPTAARRPSAPPPTRRRCRSAPRVSPVSSTSTTTTTVCGRDPTARRTWALRAWRSGC